MTFYAQKDITYALRVSGTFFNLSLYSNPTVPTVKGFRLVIVSSPDNWSGISASKSVKGKSVIHHEEIAYSHIKGPMFQKNNNPTNPNTPS